MMKESIVYSGRSFLLIIVSVWIVYPLYFGIAMSYERWQQQVEMDQSTAEDKHFEVHLPLHEFSRVFNSSHRELNLEGQMFDFISDPVFDKEVVHCLIWYDDNETDLLSGLASLFKHKKHHRHHQAHHSFWLPVAFYEQDDETLNYTVLSYQGKEYAPYSCHYSSKYVHKLERPPKSFSIA